MPWLMLFSPPGMTVIFFVNNLMKNKKLKLSSRGVYPNAMLRWLYGGTNMKQMLFRGQRSWKRQSMRFTFCAWYYNCNFTIFYNTYCTYVFLITQHPFLFIPYYSYNTEIVITHISPRQFPTPRKPTQTWGEHTKNHADFVLNGTQIWTQYYALGSVHIYVIWVNKVCCRHWCQSCYAMVSSYNWNYDTDENRALHVNDIATKSKLYNLRSSLFYLTVLYVIL